MIFNGVIPEYFGYFLVHTAGIYAVNMAANSFCTRM
jgi:hypothetical protein